MNNSIKKYLHENRSERSPDLELAILLTQENRVENICTYASKVIGGRWLEAEPIILEGSIEDITKYLQDVVRGRWAEAEPILLERGKLEDAMYYAVNVMGCRWIEFEKKFLDTFRQFLDSKCDRDNPEEMLKRARMWWKLSMILSTYIEGVIKERWEEAEDVISRADDTVRLYYRIRTGIKIERVWNYENK